MSIPRQKRWQLSEQAPESYIDRLKTLNISPVLAQILHNRGYIVPDDALSFLGYYDQDDNPFCMKGMVEAVYRLRMAIRRGEKIAVYGDFDCDGVTATALLTEVLSALGADVKAYIPDRVDEGYGLNSPALKTLAEAGVRVVVTVDCGIRSVQEVEDGISYGLDMIVTDHHSVGREVPPALAVLNPKQAGCPYPDKMLAGVGIAYKLAQGLFMEAQRRGYRKGSDWRPEDWLDLVAIGTVADIAPLVGENRALVREGLKSLNVPRRPGLLALYKEAGVASGSVNATTIGFQIGPRINAAGRLQSAMLAYDLLTVEDPALAASLAADLDRINTERQEKTAAMQELAEGQFGEVVNMPLLFAVNEQFEQGIVGLVASRLTEKHYRPSVVVQRGEEESHGSCRSIPEFHITRALEQCEDLLDRFGGHAAAAGFTVKNRHIKPLEERLLEIAESELTGKELIPELGIDHELALSEATMDLIDSLSALEPTGEANPQPVFMTRNMRITSRAQVGAEGKHLKLRLFDGEGELDAIAFRWGDFLDNLPDIVDVAYHLEINEWNGRRSIQINVLDIHPASG
nr:single-stranded-DNA-specific exonuclease RecJ [Anaerolineae bacterium]